MNPESDIRMRPKKIKRSEWGVHIHHCCKKHGCKYGDTDCPVAYGDVEQAHPCWDCDDEYIPDEPDFGISAPEIEWVMKERRKGYENEHKAFLKGFIAAFLIIILIHIGIAYVLS